MEHIRQITSDGYIVVITSENEDLNNHKCILRHPDKFEVVNDEIPANATFLNWITDVPQTVSKRQLKQSLVLANISLSSIDATISQIEDATEKALMEIYWNDSYEFERNHPKLVEFAQTLSITDEQADQIFILASTL